MNQKTAHGTSYLDLAKNGILTFVKYRGRDPASRSDRYMLVTLDDPPSSIKVGLSHWHMFANELKSLHAHGVSMFSRGLKEALDLLNVQRLQTGIDQYGQGRNPFYSEPAVIISITDGGKYFKNGNSNNHEIETEVCFPSCGSYSGSELTKEMFRWDQRLFTILLRIPGIVSFDNMNVDDSQDHTYEHFSSLCEYSGGKCYSASSVKSLYQTMESISQKMHPGVVLNFRKIASEQVENTFHGWKMRDMATRRSKSKDITPVPLKGNNGQSEENTRELSPPDKQSSWFNLKKMIYVRSKSGGGSYGHWPIPESYWPDLSVGTLPPRDVHPVVWFDVKGVVPVLLESFAFDKYELESSHLTQQLLAKRNPNVCWEVFINDSGREKGLSYPFGYLKSSSSGNFVNLFVMPFNYRKLIPLIDELQRQRLKPSSKWRTDFAEYISTLPAYYAQPLRTSLQLMGAHPGLVPEAFDGAMSYTITNYLRKLKKQSEMDANDLSRQEMNSTKKTSKMNDINGISIAIGSTEVENLSSQSYRNPFDISRGSLLEQVSRMRTNFLHSSVNTPHLIEEVDKHQVPIGQMGNYQQHLKKLDPLRELDTGAVRTQLFGNPFKLEKPSDKINMADEIMVEHLKRPGSPTREGQKSKQRRSRSLTPPVSHSSPPVLPSPNLRKSSITHDSVNMVLKENNLVNHKNTIVNDSSNAHKPINSKKEKDLKATGSDSLRNAADSNLVMLERHIKNDSNSIEKDRLPASSTIAEQAKSEKVLISNRKRSPSPTLSTPQPKRNNNRDVVRTENLARLTDEKSPSPSPLLAPIRQTGLSSASQVLNEEFKRKQTTQNLKLKQNICKEIRKNSKSYDGIFQCLDNVQGTLEAKRLFVKEIIKEAERFRKKQLIQYLEEWMAKLNSGNKTETGRNIKNSSKVNTSQR